MRFNSPELLDTWKRTGRFPAIHDDMAAAALNLVRGTRFLDLGCGFGLLGARIAKAAGEHVCIGVEADKSVIEAGTAAGVRTVYHHLRLTAETLDQFVSIVRCHGINVILARRVMPELFGEDTTLGVRFACAMYHAGVKEMLVEGRVVSARSTNALASIDHEIAMLITGGFFRQARRIKAVSYLQAA